VALMLRLNTSPRRLGLILGLLFVILASDQYTKQIARDNLSGRPSVFLDGMVVLQHTENTGAFLSLGATLDSGTRFLIFTFGIGVFLAGAIWMLVRRSNMGLWTTITTTLIVAGGIGNLIDRAVKGSVTDFMNVGIGWLRTGVFNIADVAIMVGIFGMLIASLKSPTVDGKQEGTQ
jgi:signal peptidase II